MRLFCLYDSWFHFSYPFSLYFISQNSRPRKICLTYFNSLFVLDISSSLVELTRVPSHFLVALVFLFSQFRRVGSHFTCDSAFSRNSPLLNCLYLSLPPSPLLAAGCELKLRISNLIYLYGIQFVTPDFSHPLKAIN